MAMNRVSCGLAPQSSRWQRRCRRLAAVAAFVGATAAALAVDAVSTVAGTAGTSGFLNATGTAALFNFTNPSGIVVDSSGNLFVADPLNNVIRKIDTSGVVTTFAGSATGVAGTADGTGTAAGLSSPLGLAIDGANNLYVADTGNHAIRMITSAGVVSTIAGTAGSGNSGYNDGTGGAAKFSSPIGIAADRNGAGGAAVNVYVADTQNNAIRQVVVSSKVVSTVAGGGPGSPGSTNGTNTNALFSHPDGIVSSANGATLYVADTFNNLIRQISISGSTATVTTLAGSGAAAYAEGTGTAASFNNPTALTLDGSGNVLVSDTSNQVIRTVNSGGVTSLVAGTANSAGAANGLALSVARFSFPSGIAAASNAVYVVDTNNKTVRKIAAAQAPGTTNPSSTTVSAGTTATFSVTGSGNPPPSYQWQVSTNSGGSWNNLTNGVNGVTGATTNQLSIASTTSALTGYQYRVVLTNGVTPDATSAAATLTVNQGPAITNTTTTYYVTVNTPLTGMTVTATGTPAPTFSYGSGFPTNWALLNTSTGAITGTPTNTDLGTYTFNITANNSVSSSTAVPFTIVVQSGPAITTQPANQTAAINTSAVFTVVASSSPAISGYKWQISTNSGGSWADLSDYGPYTGSSTATLVISAATLQMSGNQYRVVVTNSVGSSTSNAASLTVSQGPAFTSANNTTFVVNQPGTFTVTASGYPTPTLSASGVPFWAQFNPGTGVLSGTPTSTDNSPYTLTLTATNAGGTATQSFTLNVSPTSLTPVFTTQPAAQSVGLAQTATFTVAATGNPAPTFQWQRYRSGDSDYVSLTEGGQYSGTTTATLTISNVTAEMNGDQYRAVATNSLGTATSGSASLTVTASGVFTTIVGKAGVRGSTDGVGTAALLNAPTDAAMDANGNLYIADAGNHVIRRMNLGGIVTVFAGTVGTPGYADGWGTAAKFNTPTAVAVDSAGNVYVSDTSNQLIRMISPAGLVSTIAGTAGLTGDVIGDGTTARFSFPEGIAVDAQGRIYVADMLNNKIKRIVAGGGAYTVSTITTTDTSGNPVTLNLPNGVAVDSSYNIYVADTRNHVIRKMNQSGTTSILAGSVGVSGSADGTDGAARFNQPEGVAVDSNGNVYVADTWNDTIRKITASGVVTTVAGTAGAVGSADGAAGTVRFNQPYGVTVDSSGTLYVVDTLNHTIRRSGVGTAPQITTDVQSSTVPAGQNATFTVVATGTPVPSYQWQRQAAGTSGFVNLVNNSTYAGVNTSTLIVTGTTEAMSGDQFQVVVTNLVAPNATSATATLIVQPAIVVPVITTQPTGATVNRGDTATFTVAATGPTPLTYQWKKNGAAIGGANTATLTISNAQATSAGQYSVVVTNANGSVESNAVALVVNTAPVLQASPQAQVASAGGSVTFTAAVTGGTSYLWRKNGTAIPGATNATLTLSNVSPSDMANYDVVVTNSLGSITTSPAQLTVVAGTLAPKFTLQPASQTVVTGGMVQLLAAASGAPTPTYQWRKNGSALTGATNAALTLTSTTDSAVYDVVATNSAGSATSLPASVNVIARSYAGVYFGTINGIGSFAMYVRPDNTGVFLGYIPSSTAPVMTLALQVADNGQFTFTQSAVASLAELTSDPVQAAALGSLTVTGTIASDGTISGTTTGALSAPLTGSRSADTGSTQNLAGYYRAGAANSGATLLTIASATGQAFALAQSGGVVDGAAGSVTSTGAVTVTTTRTTISEAITPASGSVSGLSAGAVTGTFSGAVESAVTAQRLANISSRARVGSGDSVGIAGFVITGTESKPVLIRAVGPTLAGFGISGALATPKLDLYRGSAVIATNTGVSTATNAGAITAAASQVGTFALTSNADSAILTTLEPGSYTAQVSGASGGSGVVLIEVYDLSATASAGKVVNISTRAPAGAGENVLSAGVIINGTTPKRVLIRGIGPGLAAFGLSGTLAQPTLALTTLSGQPIASNTGWTNSADSMAITTAGLQVGAFGLASGDSALIVTLAPGAYTALVSGAGGSSGLAMVEVYELP